MGLFNIGSLYCKDCFIAESSNLVALSWLNLFLSELSEIIGVISETPISVAFSKNHSNRSVFFVNEIPILSFGKSLLKIE